MCNTFHKKVGFFFMDVISYQKANRAKKAIRETLDKLGLNGTENDKDIVDVYENVKARLEALEEKDPEVKLFNRIGEVSKNTMINLNKHNLRIGTLLNQIRYHFTDMVVDDFFDDSGIDYERSVNIIHDDVNGLVKQEDPSLPAELVLVAEAFHSMNMFFISSMVSDNLSKIIKINLQEGRFNNTEFLSGGISLEKHEDGSYSFQGVYETDVISLGESIASVDQINITCTVPEGTTFIPYVSFSEDGENFTEYSTDLTGFGNYVKFKFEFISKLETVLESLHLFIREGNGIYQDGSFKLNKEADNTILKRNIQKYNGFLFDENKAEVVKSQYEPMYRMKRTISKGWNR